MTGKTDFTDEEWTRLKRGPFIAGMAISLSDPGGPIELVKETAATLKTVTGAAAHGDRGELVTALAGEVAAEGNSLLVTFDLTPSGAGTLLRMTETGFREMGWEVAVLEEQYRDHTKGWDFFLPRLVAYAPGARP